MCQNYKKLLMKNIILGFRIQGIADSYELKQNNNVSIIIEKK